MEDSIFINLSNKVFIDSIKIAKTFNTEGHIKFNQEGILIQNIDCVNVCLNSILIKKEGTNQFLINKDLSIFLNFEDLYNIIKNNKKENITIKILDSPEKPEKLYLNLDSFKSEIVLLEEENSFKEIPSLNHNLNFKMDSKKFKEVIKNLKNISDRTIFKYEGQKKEFLLYTLNNLDSKMEYNILINEIEGQKEEDLKAIFSNEYLNHYIGNILTEDLKIFISSEYPLMLIQEDRFIQYKFILAPRIEE